MHPIYKLTYFNYGGRAEPIRLIFHYGGIKFEDERVTKEEFIKMKPALSFGQLPVLNIDGITYNQGYALCRFAAAQADIAGKTDLENLKIDSVVDTLEDLNKKCVDYLFTSEDKKTTELRKSVTEFVTCFLERLEENAKKNGGFMALDRFTWADIALLCTYTILRNYDKDNHDNPLAKYPTLRKIKDRVLENDAIREYLKNSARVPIYTNHIQDEV